MIAILTGAIKNVGDYLIVDRSKRLLKEFVGEDILDINRFENVESRLPEINQCSALVLCGGPAYAADVFSGIYKIDGFIDKIQVPIIPFGLGWSGKPSFDVNDFRFNAKDLDLLNKVHDKIESSSCRDVMTQAILRANGIENVKMTGCPVWYDARFFGKGLTHKPVKKVVISTPASQKLLSQTNDLVNQVIELFPDAEFYLTFHRGIFTNNLQQPRKALSYLRMAFHGKKKNVKVLDVSGDLSKLDFYNDCDFHVGYRVHAHLMFLSQRKPSVLINEDGRGLGMVKSMELPELNFNDENVIEATKKVIENYKATNFQDFERVFKFIDHNFKEVMLPFLKSIPS